VNRCVLFQHASIVSRHLPVLAKHQRKQYNERASTKRGWFASKRAGLRPDFSPLYFTTRRYASAVLPSRVRLSVRRPSVCHKPLLHRNSKRLDESSWFLVRRLSFHCENGNLQILGYFPWDCVPNSGLRKFRHGKSIALSTNSSSSSSSTVELVDDIYTTIDESWLLTTNLSTVTL